MELPTGRAELASFRTPSAGSLARRELLWLLGEEQSALVLLCAIPAWQPWAPWALGPPPAWGLQNVPEGEWQCCAEEPSPCHTAEGNCVLLPSLSLQGQGAQTAWASGSCWLLSQKGVPGAFLFRGALKVKKFKANSKKKLFT